MPEDLTDEFFEHRLRTISDIGFRRTVFIVQLAGTGNERFLHVVCPGFGPGQSAPRLSMT